MTGIKIGAAALGLMLGVLATSPGSAWNRGNVQVLTVLPDLLNQPGVKSSVEGLTVGPDGNIYAPSFGFNTIMPGKPGAPTGPANLFVISPNGKIVNQVSINCPTCPGGAASSHMLGLRFNPVNQHLWVLDFGAGLVLDLGASPQTGGASVLAGPIPNSGLNALTFDKAGNGYVSDSFQGAIWKIPSGGGTPSTPWISDPLLLGNGTPFVPFGTLTPPFGANGVEFNNEGTILFVANTAFHQIIQIPVKQSGGTFTPDPGNPPTIFITCINAPDGIAIDSKDNIWICANQEDEIVVIDNTGKVIAKLGDFEDLTLFLPYAGANKAIDSAWTLQVNGYTVSRLPAKIPPISGN